jgi:tripeptide aminopeptidase
MPLPLRRRTLVDTQTLDWADDPRISAALLTLGRDRAWVNAQHLELCRVPAPTFMEQRRAVWIQDQLRALGCEARVDRGGNVVCFPYGDPGGPLVALTAHMDTVLAPRVPDDVRVGADGRFFGPGVSDNGVGLAGLLAIARVARAHRLPELANLVLCANVGEEGEGNLSGMRYLCRQSSVAHRLQAFIVLDGPGTDSITTQALGSRRFEVLFQGPGGHSWGDFGVGNPIHALSRVVADFADLFVVGSPKASFNFGVVEGGASINSIPTEARAKLDIRSESGDRMNQLAELLTDCVERALGTENTRVAESASRVGRPASPWRVTAKIREIGSRPGGRLAPDSPLLESLRAVDRYCSIQAVEDCASTDANIPLSLGLPAVALGAGGAGGGAHTAAEWFHPEGRELALRRVFLLLLHLAKQVAA